MNSSFDGPLISNASGGDDGGALSSLLRRTGFSLFQRMVQGTYEVSDGWYAVFGQTYAFKDLPFFGVSWSLCVEEHFYLLIAPLLLLMGQRRVWVLASLALLIAIPIGVRRIDPSVNTFQTHARIDQCAIGVFLAYWPSLSRGGFSS